MTPIYFSLVSNIEFIGDKLKLETFLWYSIQIGYLVEVFDFLNGVIQAYPSILKLVIFVELLRVEVFCCLVRSRLSLLS